LISGKDIYQKSILFPDATLGSYLQKVGRHKKYHDDNSELYYYFLLSCLRIYRLQVECKLLYIRVIFVFSCK